MNFENYYPVIEAYIKDQLRLEEKISFEAAIEANPLLKEEVEKFRMEEQALRILAQSRLKSNIKQWQQETSTAESEFSEEEVNKIMQWQLEASKPKLTYFIRIAAAAIFIISISIFIITFQIHRFSNGPLALRHLTPVQVDTRKSEQEENIFNNGVNAFLRKDYKKAISLLANMEPEAAEFDEAQLYIGESYLRLKKFEQAAQTFKNIQDPKYKDLAQWNLLISWLGNGQTDVSFYDLLNQIIQDVNHPYREKAIYLQKDLKSFWR